MNKRDKIRIAIAVLVGYLVTEPIYIFVKYTPFFAIVPGIIISCNIAKSHQIYVSLAVAFLVTFTFLGFTIADGPVTNQKYFADEFTNYIIGLIIAALLGYGYSVSRKKPVK
jgi:hypothetical protein